jgi:hypothetical protein
MEEMAANELRPKYVTQEEASAIVDLHSRLGETRQKVNLLTIDDLSESLQISEAEAQRLLDHVRNTPSTTTARHDQVTDYTVLYYFGLISLVASMVCAIMYLALRLTNPYWSSDRGMQVFAFVWLGIWCWHFRRPIRRFFAGAIPGSDKR